MNSYNIVSSRPKTDWFMYARLAINDLGNLIWYF